MVLVGLKYRVEVDAGDSEVVEVAQLGLYALKISTEVVVVPDVTVLIGLVIWSSAPVIADNAVCGDVLVYLSAPAKSVREDLIHYSALEKVRSLVFAAVNRELEEIAGIDSTVMAVHSLDIVTDTADCVGEIVVMNVGVTCIVIC